MEKLKNILEDVYHDYLNDNKTEVLKSFGNEKNGDEYGGNLVVVKTDNTESGTLFFIVESGQIGKGFTDYYKVEFFKTEAEAVDYYNSIKR